VITTPYQNIYLLSPEDENEQAMIKTKGMDGK
jgi:hypothetical protein